MGWVVNAMPWLIYPQERDSVPTVQVAGWVSTLVHAGAENLTLIRIWSPGGPSRGKSLIVLPFFK